MLRLTALVACLATPALADRILADVTCEPVTSEFEQNCVFTLTEGGLPVEGAAFTVATAMPSMPMAHNAPPVPAAATDTPGTYAVDIEFDMTGDWALTLDISAPRRDRIVLNVLIDAGTGHTGPTVSH